MALEETTAAMAKLDVQVMGTKKVVKRKAKRKPVPRKWMSKPAEWDPPLDLGHDMDLARRLTDKCESCGLWGGLRGLPIRWSAPALSRGNPRESHETLPKLHKCGWLHK